MSKEELLIRETKHRLEEIFTFFQQKGATHDRGLAHRAVGRASEAIVLIKEFPSQNRQAVKSAKEVSLSSLEKAKVKAEEYMEQWDHKPNTPPSFTPSEFLNRGYGGLEYFLQIVRGNYF